ncbi:MAG TPA: protein kinase [Hyphomonadaceae bacterium]|nr:protein kinase [Hyphomonadaceae bacterium]HPN04569.1 protein kinase [Hyphomonadaceae bacterium]
MKCPNCQSDVPADARFCGECGQAMKQLGRSLAETSSAGPDLSGLRTIDDMDTKAPRGEQQRVMQPGEVFAGRYEVSQVIGEGGMGVVYRAHDKLTEKDVALKLIRADRLAGKDAVKRLIREGVTSRDIRHPNVVAVYDVGDADGQPYMSMEFLGGLSLRSWNRQRLQSSTDCSMKTAANIVAEILAGLDAAHKAGVVHRDLKPENVMLTTVPNDQGAQLKILDFGVARAAGAGDTGATSLGTRGYMAPEQITAPDAAQPSADLYSLSVMFYELLVGVVPQGHWQPPSGGRSDVPPAIDKLIERGLANNPRVRPQNVAEYGQLLADAMKSTGNLSSAFAPWLEKIEQSGFKPLVDNIKSNLDKSGFNTGGQQAHKPPPQLQQSHAPPVGKKNMFQWFMYSLTKKYVDGKGRAHRMEYWSFQVIWFVFAVIMLMIDAEMFTQETGLPADVMYQYMSTGSYSPPLFSLLWVATIAPVLSLISRRLHDFGQNGWIAAVCIIPGIGSLIALIIGLPGGNRGENKYGPDPLGGAG